MYTPEVTHGPEVICVHLRLVIESVFCLKIVSKKVYAHPKNLNFGNLKMKAEHRDKCRPSMTYFQSC